MLSAGLLRYVGSLSAIAIGKHSVINEDQRHRLRHERSTDTRRECLIAAAPRTAHQKHHARTESTLCLTRKGHHKGVGSAHSVRGVIMDMEQRNHLRHIALFWVGHRTRIGLHALLVRTLCEEGSTVSLLIFKDCQTLLIGRRYNLCEAARQVFVRDIGEVGVNGMAFAECPRPLDRQIAQGQSERVRGRVHRCADDCCHANGREPSSADFECIGVDAVGRESGDDNAP